MLKTVVTNYYPTAFMPETALSSIYQKRYLENCPKGGPKCTWWCEVPAGFRLHAVGGDVASCSAYRGVYNPGGWYKHKLPSTTSTTTSSSSSPCTLAFFLPDSVSARMAICGQSRIENEVSKEMMVATLSTWQRTTSCQLLSFFIVVLLLTLLDIRGGAEARPSTRTYRQHL